MKNPSFPLLRRTDVVFETDIELSFRDTTTTLVPTAVSGYFVRVRRVL